MIYHRPRAAQCVCGWVGGWVGGWMWVGVGVETITDRPRAAAGTWSLRFHLYTISVSRCLCVSWFQSLYACAQLHSSVPTHTHFPIPTLHPHMSDHCNMLHTIHTHTHTVYTHTHTHKHTHTHTHTHTQETALKCPTPKSWQGAIRAMHFVCIYVCVCVCSCVCVWWICVCSCVCVHECACWLFISLLFIFF